MNRDALDMAKFGMGLMFFALLLYYVIDSVNIGKVIGDNAFQGLEQVKISAEKSTMEELKSVDTVMSAATAFSLIEYNRKNIRQITCYICNPTHGEKRLINETLCIHNHLKGSLIVSVEFVKSYGLYDISFRPY